MLAAVMDGDPDARHPLVERYFRAMQRGPEGEEELVALFAEDAVYVEPFSGDQAPHVGRAEIQAWLHASWDHSPPELTLRVDRVRVDGDQVEAAWTCTSPALPGVPMMHGMSKLALIIRTRAQPGARDQVRDLYLKHLAPRAEANQAQEAVVLCFDGQDPDVLYLFEVYRDPDALQQAAQAPWFADYMGEVGPLLAGEPEVTMASPVWATGVGR